MRILDYVPESLKQYIKLLRLRRRYSGRCIGSYLIADDALLGVDCTISRDVEIGPHVVIGDYSYVNAGTIVASGTIGKYCSIGYFCQIGMAEHPINYMSTSPRTYGQKNIFGVPPFWNDYASPPLIENDIWIGSHALILQGVHIASGSVIAGGAVVTKDVPPYTIVAGVPAKVLRRRFDDSTIEQLLKLKWWDMPVSELATLKDIFERKEEATTSILKQAL